MTVAGVRREAFHLEAPGGGRFCLLTRPAGDACGSVLLVPPFAEELNKSRRMMALAACAFAGRGWRVLQPDLLGCGDSAGDFGDAGWSAWVDDVGRSFDWLKQQGGGPTVLWSVRAGSLLVADWLARTGLAVPWMAWQPVLNGKQHLQQFLRLKGVSDMLNEADARASMAALRAALAAEQAVEVAGYMLSPALVAGMEAATLGVPPEYAERVHVLELSGQPDPSCSPGISAWVKRSADAGVSISAQALQGVAFWQTQEIETSPDLIAASCAVLEAWCHAH